MENSNAGHALFIYALVPPLGSRTSNIFTINLHLYLTQNKINLISKKYSKYKKIIPVAQNFHLLIDQIIYG